jgi:hypothetical protein
MEPRRGLSFILRAVTALCLSLPASMPTASFGWGQEGHRIVAALATEQLHPHTRSRLKELLGDGGLVAVAHWADEIRKDRPETAPWHFVNIPGRRRDYRPSRDCVLPRDGDCVIAAIERFRLVLMDRTRTQDERAEAAKFLTHFVADVHQPLHCLGDHEGGNTLEVLFYGERVNPVNLKPWNLHAVWDGALIERSGLSEEEYVRMLRRWLDREPLEDAQLGTPQDWALESHQAAMATAYQLPSDRNLDETYVRRALPVMSERLARAAVRLAKLLNDALAKP